MKKSILTLIMVFTVLLSSNLGFADEKYPNWLKGLEDNGRNSALITVNGFQVYEDDIEHEAWFYMENETIMMPLKNLSEMMGAEVSYKDNDKKMTLKKDNKTFIFEEGKASYLSDNKEIKLSEKVALKDNQLHAPFWDIINAYDMACKIEYDKTDHMKINSKLVNVTIWNKKNKVIYYDTAKGKEIVNNVKKYTDYENDYNKRNNLQINEYKIDKLLIDSSSKYQFYAVIKENALVVKPMQNSKYVKGSMLFITNGEAKGEIPFFYHEGQPIWVLDPNLTTHKDGTKILTDTNLKDIKQSQKIGFYTGLNNTMTIIDNPFYGIDFNNQ